ncbi:hypothetical protein JTE90_007257 [Oedothorax gibbosus]|uniref:Uncharacterized protein n=1 Tax=Oedothorax gibbosus TaxID=931172 RepID=A0AAV6VLK1_9ARAC|nr:hypothetical protein JTE90_007257 [Oedothorax gibbosus]
MGETTHERNRQICRLHLAAKNSHKVLATQRIQHPAVIPFWSTYTEYTYKYWEAGGTGWNNLLILYLEAQVGGYGGPDGY